MPVLIGIMPLQSTRHAEFLHNEVPGITLTERARERMRWAGANGGRKASRWRRNCLLDSGRMRRAST